MGGMGCGVRERASFPMAFRRIFRERVSYILPMPPRLHDLPDGLFQRLRDIPRWIMCTHLPEVAVVTYMVARAGLFEVGVSLLLAGEFLRDFEGFQNGARIGLAATEVVNLSGPGRCDIRRHEARHVQRMN